MPDKKKQTNNKPDTSKGVLDRINQGRPGRPGFMSFPAGVTKKKRRRLESGGKLSK